MFQSVPEFVSYATIPTAPPAHGRQQLSRKHPTPYHCKANMAPLARRHPSLTIVVVVTMFVLILFYANSGSSSTSFPLHSSKFRARPPSALSVTDHMKLYEAYYDENLKDRENLIKKLGPTREKVQACVSLAPFSLVQGIYVCVPTELSNHPVSRPINDCTRFVRHPYSQLTCFLMGENRGLFHPRIRMSSQGATRGHSRRWRKMGMWVGSYR